MSKPDQQVLLCVDDNEIHCYALGRSLANLGFKVISAHNGTEALRIMSETKANVVLLDINMPDLNGFEVCRRIRANDGLDEVAIVFHTATSATESSHREALDAGADAFLTYPVAVTHLRSVIEGCIAKRTAGKPKD